MAKNLAHAEGCRIAARDPGREDPPGHVGWAVLGILGSVAATNRVKERVAASEQREVMAVVDSEVDAVRARRP